jgi:hypothetical protein
MLSGWSTIARVGKLIGELLTRTHLKRATTPVYRIERVIGPLPAVEIPTGLREKPIAAKKAVR